MLVLINLNLNQQLICMFRLMSRSLLQRIDYLITDFFVLNDFARHTSEHFTAQGSREKNMNCLKAQETTG